MRISTIQIIFFMVAYIIIFAVDMFYPYIPNLTSGDIVWLFSVMLLFYLQILSIDRDF